MRRESEFLSGVAQSRALHAGLVEPPATPDEFRAYLRRARRRSQESFLVTVGEGGPLAGVINVNDIVMYSLRSASLGYYAFVPYAGCGLMRQAIRLVVGRCFDEFRLHRLEASIQPHNERSIRLVAGLGFSLEGVSRRYLKIGGRWRDHQRWALLAEEWRPRDVGRDPPGARRRMPIRERRDAPASATSTRAARPAPHPSATATRRRSSARRA